MNRFWLAWKIFMLHALIFLMAWSGDILASSASTSEPHTPQPGSMACVEASDHEDGAPALPENLPAEQSEEFEQLEDLSSSAKSGALTPWLVHVDLSHRVARQRGRAPPRAHASLYQASSSFHLPLTRSPRGPPASHRLA